MELNDAVRRIVGQHWALICVIALIPVVAVGYLRHGSTPSYTATARMVLDTPDPKSGAESVAIADTAKAIATSPAEVSAALGAAHIRGRNAADIAAKHVDVRALGTSDVLQLTVSDRYAATAATIANALASRVIQTRERLSDGQVQQSLAAMDGHIQDDTKQITNLEAQATSLAAQATGAVGRKASALQNQRDGVLRQRDFVVQRRAVRESERLNLLASLVSRPNAEVISRATPPKVPDSKGMAPDIVLALLLGGIMGVGAAGLKETLKPSLVGAEAVAEELNAPLLAHLTGQAKELPAPRREQIANRLRMSADTARVRSVTLVPTREGANLVPLARVLGEVLSPVPTAQSPQAQAQAHTDAAGAIHWDWAHGPATGTALDTAPGRDIPITVFGVDVGFVQNSGSTGVVIVAPATLKKSELADTKNLLRVSPAPVLGVITYSGGGRRRRGASVDA